MRLRVELLFQLENRQIRFRYCFSSNGETKLQHAKEKKKAIIFVLFDRKVRYLFIEYIKERGLGNYGKFLLIKSKTLQWYYERKPEYICFHFFTLQFIVLSAIIIYCWVLIIEFFHAYCLRQYHLWISDTCSRLRYLTGLIACQLLCCGLLDVVIIYVSILYFFSR